jgi:hypothetical protein
LIKAKIIASAKDIGCLIEIFSISFNDILLT